MVYKKFLILSFSFFSKPSIFWKRILAVGDRLWVWWLALFLELGWHVIVWCHIEILALCDKNTKRRLHSSWLKKKNRKFYWPGQRHDPDNDLGDDPGNDSCDNLGVKKNTKYIWKIDVKQKRHYMKCIKPSQKWEPVGHRRIMRQA